MKLVKVSNYQYSVGRKSPILDSIPRVTIYGPQAKSGPHFVFVNKVLFKHNHGRGNWDGEHM